MVRWGGRWSGPINALEEEAYRRIQHIKYLAAYRLNRAILFGRITRAKKCSLCGKECSPQGHHPDYDFWYLVVWLCVKCHRRLHINLWELEDDDPPWRVPGKGEAILSGKGPVVIEMCKQRIPYFSGMGTRPCSRRAKPGGYCWQHGKEAEDGQ